MIKLLGLSLLLLVLEVLKVIVFAFAIPLVRARW